MDVHAFVPAQPARQEIPAGGHEDRKSVAGAGTGLGPQRRSARPPIQQITAADSALMTPNTPDQITGQPSTVPA